MKREKRKQAAELKVETYRTIDGKEFIQRRLVLGQMEQLIEQLRDVEWPDFNNFNLVSFHKAIGGKLPVALAIILTPKDGDPRTKDIDALAEDLRFTLSIDEGLRALKDFFYLNPVVSVAESLRDLSGIQGAMKEAGKTGSQT